MSARDRLYEALDDRVRDEDKTVLIEDFEREALDEQDAARGLRSRFEQSPPALLNQMIAELNADRDRLAAEVNEWRAAAAAEPRAGDGAVEALRDGVQDAQSGGAS